MVVMQIVFDSTTMPTVGQPISLHTNLPTGYYVFRLIDIIFDDNEPASAANVLYTIESDTWRVPYGNRARGHRIFFVNRSNNGRTAPQGYYNFLVEIRNNNMDLTLIKVGAGVSAMENVVISFDVTPTESTDTFVPFI
jgi:hypothetical protein